MEGQGDGHSRVIAGINNLGVGDHYADQHDLHAPHHKCCGRRSTKRVGAGGDERSTHPACCIQIYWHPHGTQASPRQAKVNISSCTEQSQLQLQPASHAKQPTLDTAFLPDEPWARQLDTLARQWPAPPGQATQAGQQPAGQGHPRDRPRLRRTPR